VVVDLLLLDFAMPGMNGAEVAREINARRPHLPALFVTGYADPEALIERAMLESQCSNRSQAVRRTGIGYQAHRSFAGTPHRDG
jgi:CheY-like chemotaxis protein